MKKTLAYIITGAAPDSLLEELIAIPASDSEKLLITLLDAEKMGWVKILGVVKGSPEEVAALIKEVRAVQENDGVKHVKVRGKRDAS